MNLKTFFKNAPDLDIEQLSIDSRVPMRNAIFFCLNGIKYDGHNFVDEAIENGAVVIIYSKDIDTNKNAIFIKVNSVNESLNRIADIFYEHPNDGIDEYIVSGCYGRSSVSHIIKYFLSQNSKCASIGINGINYNQTSLSLTFPALSPLDYFKHLNKMKKEKVTSCVFETSPISLYYKKLDVLSPKVFIYTNTSKQCGDYNACNNGYFDYLRKYLYTLDNNTCVVLNGDDDCLEELKDSVNNYVTYGKSQHCLYRISNIELNNNGCKFSFIYDNNLHEFSSKLLGEVNVYNLVAAIVALNVSGYKLNDIASIIKDVDYLEGVMERVDDELNIIIDCAYEPDSIEKALKFVNDTTSGKKIGIIGINYSDDDNRLKEILKYADEYLDVLYATEDESQESSVMSILNRLDKFECHSRVLKVIARSSAIELGIELLNKEDTMIILGKGAESYMSMGLGKQYYSGDKHFVVKYLRKRREEENEISEVY